jgi:hypothetical protein
VPVFFCFFLFFPLPILREGFDVKFDGSQAKAPGSQALSQGRAMGSGLSCSRSLARSC